MADEMILTVADLRAARALGDCPPLTAASMDRARAAGLPVTAAACLLDAPVWAEYHQSVATALLAGLVATWQRRALDGGKPR